MSLLCVGFPVGRRRRGSPRNRQSLNQNALRGLVAKKNSCTHTDTHTHTSLFSSYVIDERGRFRVRVHMYVFHGEKNSGRPTPQTGQTAICLTHVGEAIIEKPHSPLSLSPLNLHSYVCLMYVRCQHYMLARALNSAGRKVQVTPHPTKKTSWR